MFQVIIPPAQFNVEFFFRFDNCSSLFLHHICILGIKLKTLLHFTHGSLDIENWLRFDDTRAKIKVVALHMVHMVCQPMAQKGFQA